jgi:CheY-like chemotaxis protein
MKKYKWGNGSALVVEDDTSTRKVLSRMLKDYGLNAAEAGNGQIALDEIEKQSSGVIFLDLMMPVMDGFEFLEELRKSLEGRAIPIMVITLKELTYSDRLRLNGGVEKLIEKNLSTRMVFSKKFAIFWNPTHLDSLLRKHLPNPGIFYNFPVGFESKNKPTGLRL